MHTDVYFDPACPWTWITSRWLVEVRQHRPLSIRWRPFSLLLNDRLADVPLARRLELAESTRVLRLFEAVRHRHGDAPIDDLYTRVGTGYHHDDRHDFSHLEPTLAEMGLDASFLDALDDPSWDAVIEAAMAEARQITGDSLGVPLMVMSGDGPTRAFYGPVFSPAPTGLAALSAWDGLVTLIAAPGFFELKRPRTGEPVLPARPSIGANEVIDLSG
jgi:predicted DsbA family dithiol-disulfide isomerase